MSKHHHHPDEGHGAGEAPRSMRGRLHHNWFFYVSGIFLLVALICFVLSGNLAWRFSPALPSPVPVAGQNK
jgi:hypothetical protein